MTNSTTKGPVAQPGIMNIAPYVPGKSNASFAGKIYKVPFQSLPARWQYQAGAEIRHKGDHYIQSLASI